MAYAARIRFAHSFVLSAKRYAVIKNGLLFFVMFSFSALAKDLCPKGSATFFKANNGDQSVMLCLSPQVSGPYFSSAKLFAFVTCEKTYELNMAELFRIRLGETLVPKDHQKIFESTLGKLLFKIEAEISDVSQFKENDLKIADFKAVMRLTIGEWVWRKDFSEILEELDEIEHIQAQRMAQKLISEAVENHMIH